MVKSRVLLRSAAAALAIVAALAACAAPHREAQPDAERVVVRVRTKDGKPLADAAVYVASTEPFSYMSWAPTPMPPAPWVCDGVTDASGTVSFEPGIGDYLARVRQNGYVTVALMSGFDVGRDKPDVVLEPAARVEGRVTDAKTAAPLPGVTVRAVPSQIDPYRQSRLDVFGEAVTDADGRYRLDCVPPGGFVVVRADAPGFGRGHIDVRCGAAGATVIADLSLAAPATLTGVARDPDGSPRPDADVFAIARDPDLVRREISYLPWPCWAISDADAQTKTAADGTFRLEGVASNVPCVLYVIHRPEPGDTSHARVLSALLVVAEPAREPALELGLTPHPRAFVRLLDAGRSPLRYCDATTWIDGHGRYDTRSDADGWAEVAPEFGGLRRGKVRVRVLVTGGDAVVGMPGGEIDVDMSDGKDARVEVPRWR